MQIFETGMRIKLLNDDGTWVHGEVIETGQKGFFVRWDDLEVPSDYTYDNMPSLLIEPAAQPASDQLINPA